MHRFEKHLDYRRHYYLDQVSSFFAGKSYTASRINFIEQLQIQVLKLLRQELNETSKIEQAEELQKSGLFDPNHYNKGVKKGIGISLSAILEEYSPSLSFVDGHSS